MDEAKWERFAALTGIALALLLAVRTLITPTPVSPLQVFFARNQAVWLWTVWLTGVVVVLGTWFYAALRRYLVNVGQARLGDVLFGAWLIQGTLAAARHALIAVPAVVSVPDPITATLLVAASVMLGMVWFTFLAQTLAVAYASIRSRAFPAWYVALSFVAALNAALGTLVIVMVDGYFSRAGLFRWVVLWSYIAWAGITGIVLFTKLGARQPQEN